MKGISDYIIALVFVVIVIVVVSYLIFTYFGGFNNVGKSTDCTAKKLRYCFELQSGNPPSSWNSYAPGCTQVGVTPDCTSTTTTTS